MPEDGAICLHIIQVIQKQHRACFLHVDVIHTSTLSLIVSQEYKAFYKRKLSWPTTSIYAPKLLQYETEV